MNNVTLIKLNTITMLEYFKNFWILAKEQNVRYYLILIVNHIGIYPLNFYLNLVTYLNNLNSIFSDHLIAFSFICKDDGPINILKPLFNMYKFVRPYNICNTYEEALQFFNKQN